MAMQGRYNHELELNMDSIIKSVDLIEQKRNAVYVQTQKINDIS